MYQIDSECRLPVAERFVSHERKIPAGAAVGFAEAGFASELVRHGDALFGCIIDRPVLGEQVDARSLHVFIEPHCGADAVTLVNYVVFAKGVPGELEAVPTAPFADLSGERVDEKTGHQFKMVETDSRTAVPVNVEEEFRQMIQNVIAEPFLCLFRHRTGPVGVVRFIGENAGDRFSEFAGNFRRIFFMGYFDEFADCFRVADVKIPAAVIPGVVGFRFHIKAEKLFAVGKRVAFAEPPRSIEAASVRSGGEPCQIRIIVNGFGKLLTMKPLAPEFRVFAGDESARRAGRPAVLVIKPCIHAELSGFVNAGADAGKPLVAEIGCIESDAGVHEESAESHPFHVPDLSAEFFRFEFPVPCPERSSAELCRRIFDLFDELLYHLQEILSLLVADNIEVFFPENLDFPEKNKHYLIKRAISGFFSVGKPHFPVPGEKKGLRFCQQALYCSKKCRI